MNEQEIAVIGALNPLGFIQAANDLGGSVLDFEGAVTFFTDLAQTQGESALSAVLEEVPILKPRNDQGKSIWNNLGDAVVAILGGVTQEEQDLAAQNSMLQQQILQQQLQDQEDGSQGSGVPDYVWVLLAVGGAFVAYKLLSE